MLYWWLESCQNRKCPRLSQKVAIDTLSTPATSAEAEQVFSRARLQIAIDRTQITAEAIAQKEMPREPADTVIYR